MAQPNKFEIPTVLESTEKSLEKRHIEEVRSIAKGMDADEKRTILKTIGTEDLINEVKRRVALLEERDAQLKAIFKIKTE